MSRNAPAATPPCFQTTPLPGLVVYWPKLHSDDRGLFVKTFHAPSFAAAGLTFDTREEFYSLSRRGVLRGMHFQIPPHAHAKLVTCLRGRILDVVVDLRRGSPTYRQSWSMELGEESRPVLHVPVGLAHGFLALSEEALVHYRTSTEHNPEHDRGIRWDSFGFAWPEPQPLVSPRDAAFPALADFSTQF